MIEQLTRYLYTNFPEYTELAYLLKLSEVTWPRFGLSASDLAKCDPIVLRMIEIWL